MNLQSVQDQGSGPAEAMYYLTFRTSAGAGRRQANSRSELSRLLLELRLARARDITVVDTEGRLISFDPGGS